ncbi:hypothetical protein DY000_02020967 [Brassica cretica]|uniref:Auxin efflux carrier component n=1 Tax=Brassica cretica TaxID=69181 RepID=A0ABQ7E5R2_BRACR|nr:hypothetical protein DY000_02020967 [Brassica cretica]
MWRCLRSSAVKPVVVLGIVCVRYILLPIIGIGIVKSAESFGFLPADPLFQYVLMLQFTLPPAMNIGTMTQLYNVGQDECSVLMLWTYLVAILALTNLEALSDKEMAPKTFKRGESLALEVGEILSLEEGEIAENTQEVKVYWRRILLRNRMNWNLEVLDKEEDYVG